MPSLHKLALAMSLAVAAGTAAAQAYPSKPVRMVVPFGPGTTSVLVGRMIADRDSV